MNNVTHATDSKRTFVWEIYNYYSELGEPAYRIKMSRLLWGCELYMVRKVSDTRWIGLVKRVSLRRRIKIVLDSVDIQVIERALGRELADKEYFADGQEVDLTCHHYEGLTLHGVLSANIGRGMAYRSDVVSIVPYGSLYTPITLAPAPVISEPLPDARKALAGETVHLKHVTYARRGNLDRWLAVCVFNGQEVHFPLYPEHAKHIQKHTDRILRTQGITHFHIELYVVVDWNTYHNDLRLSGVQGDDGKLYPLVRELPTAQPVKAEEDGRTEIQKKLGMGSKYSKMDFRLDKKQAS